MIHCFFSNLFLRTTLRAVRYHKYAIRYLNRDSYDEEEKVERALKWVKKCGSLADKLVEASEKMVEKSDYLREMTHKAYVTTNKDEVRNRGDIKKAGTEKIFTKFGSRTFYESPFSFMLPFWNIIWET